MGKLLRRVERSHHWRGGMVDLASMSLRVPGGLSVLVAFRVGMGY